MPAERMRPAFFQTERKNAALGRRSTDRRHKTGD
jgi:hypothetical protein